ncbi:MAG: nickel pincer cofactor biosynthesis protein LarB [Ignavibacteria bacterium]|nr:nickel pincer cofactor biosynthesis protein LarB [Ignavibacteria bacterium]
MDHLKHIEGFARLDFDRHKRTGIPESILAEGKTTEQIISLVRCFTQKAGYSLTTRIRVEAARVVQQQLQPDLKIVYNETGRTLVAQRAEHTFEPTGGKIAVLAAGTSDLPVAEEARVTAEVMGCEVMTAYDVGVAGIHRLLKPLEQIHELGVSAVVVVAGMEGALPTVVRGLVPIPVIGVPTSVGYGYGGKGEAALMTMLQSCAPGLTVVNIDNGFGAGATAALIANCVAAAHAGRKNGE